MSAGSAARARSRNRPHDTYGTPRPFWLALDHEFHFTVDVAADDDHHMTARYYTPAENGLIQPWAGEVVWCNPPYSDIAPWVARARAERKNGTRRFYCCLPGRALPGGMSTSGGLLMRFAGAVGVYGS